MKKIVGKDAKIYNYMENVFKTVSSYYNYEYIKIETSDINSSLEDRIKNYYNDNVKNGFKKYCYSGASIDKDQTEFGFLAVDIDSIYQDAEMISMDYRILEELKLEDILVKIKASKNYSLDKLLNYLEQLDVDYEICDSGNLGNIAMSFEIVMEIKDKEIILASGSKNTNKVSFISVTNYLDNILNILSVIYEDYQFDTLTKVAIITEKEEEKIVGMKLAQDLRWCEIKVDIDTNNRSIDKQIEDFKDSNFILIIDNENLNKGLIKVIDNLTKEETLVDESEIIDYIVSNI